MKDIKKGDYVKLLAVPEWLLTTLPVKEQEEIKSCVGKISIIEKIDSSGDFWVGFGVMTKVDNEFNEYNGHSFAVTAECIELVNTEGLTKKEIREMYKQNNSW